MGITSRRVAEDNGTRTTAPGPGPSEGCPRTRRIVTKTAARHCFRLQEDFPPKWDICYDSGATGTSFVYISGFSRSEPTVVRKFCDSARPSQDTNRQYIQVCLHKRPRRLTNHKLHYPFAYIASASKMMDSKKCVKLGLLVLFLAQAISAENDEGRSARVDLGDIAKEILSRQSNSQVLSLNVTNLIILLVLKGLLFGATYWGHGGGYGYKARSLETRDLVSENELMLITSYLMGDVDRDYSCLYRVACQDPSKSKNYLQGAKILLKTSKIFTDYVGYDEKYETLVRDLQDAIEFGSKYGKCEQKYTCEKGSQRK